MTQKLRKSLRKLNKEKQDKPILYSGELGVPLNGTKTVEVPNRKGFVFVRLKGNTSELIQAHNAVVSPVYGLPVLVGRQGNIYQIVGHNIDRYQGVSNTPYLPRHGSQHSFNHNLGIGGDIVWVYSQQFMPLLEYPSGSAGGMTLSLEPHFYEWNGSWKFAQNTGTPDYTPYVPTITGSARMVLSYIDPSDNSIKLVPGTPFDGSVTGSAQIAQYIPDIPRSIGVPLSAVRLTTGTTSIGWDAVYDMRDFFTVPFVPTGTAGTGNVTGPGSSTDNGIARFDGTGGTAIQNSRITIDDGDNVTGASGTISGFRGVVNLQTGTTYTTQNSDNEKIISLTNASGTTVTIHSTAEAGFNLLLIQAGTGRVTVAAGGSGNVRNYNGHTKLAGQYAMGSVFVLSNTATSPEVYLGGNTGV